MTEVVESQTKLPSLSSEARILLKEASLDAHGTIVYVRYIGGTDIQKNGKNVIPSNERREIAKLEQALEESIGLELVTACGHKGELFEVSNLGYQIADMIAL